MSDKGRPEILKMIQDHLDDKNPADKNGLTALEIAALQGQPEIVKIILDLLDDKVCSYLFNVIFGQN
jgi:ankyrin repeat protein